MENRIVSGKDYDFYDNDFYNAQGVNQLQTNEELRKEYMKRYYLYYSSGDLDEYYLNGDINTSSFPPSGSVYSGYNENLDINNIDMLYDFDRQYNAFITELKNRDNNG